MELQEDITLFLPSGAFIATYPAGYFLGDAYGSYVCDYGDDSGDYSVVAIAGTENYFLTNRPPGTSGGSYAGDLQISFSAWENIQTVLDSLNSNIFYYAMGYDINGDYRYYMTPSGYSNTYYVCNSAGQLYYYLKDDSGSGGSGTGSDFDATEIITAINSVFDAIEVGFYDTTCWLSYIQDDIQSFNTDVILLSQNMVSGFSDLVNIGNNIVGKLATLDTRLTFLSANFNDYFYSLAKSYPQLMTVRLSGNDNLFDWDSGDILQNIEVEKADAGDTVSIKKTFLGNDSSGYPPSEVRLVNASDGYSRVSDGTNLMLLGYVPALREVGTVNPNLIPVWDLSHVTSTSQMTGWLFDTSVSFGDGVSCSLAMYYEVSDMTPYLGETLTLSCIADGVIYSDTVTIPDSLPSSGNQFVFGNYMAVVLSANGNGQLFRTYNPLFNKYISHVKVEVGTKNTLAYKFNSRVYLYINAYTPPSPPILNIGGTQYTLSVSLVSYWLNGHSYFSYIYYDASTSLWMFANSPAGTITALPASDQEILNQTIYTPPNINSVSLSDFNLSTAPPLFYDGVNTIDITGNAVVTIDYYHDGTWFDYIYSAMETQIQLLTDLDIVNETIVNIENTIVDISPDNDAFNIFYIEKEDGTHESIGDAAMDVAKVVGDALSMFYRLVFEDALSNKGILSDFEDTMSGTVVGVDVWS